MDRPLDALTAPLLLVAMPQVLDPYFRRSVVFLMRHDDEEGSVGLVVNRPTEVRVQTVLEGLSIPWEGTGEAVTWFGGPVMPHLGSVLYLPDPPLDGARGEEPEEGIVVEVGGGVRMTHHVEHLAALAAQPPESFRLFLGYAGWGPGQLLEELSRHDWLAAPLAVERVFGETGDDVWADTLRALGIDPASLPAWAPGEEPGDAN